MGRELRFHLEMEAKRLQREEGLDAREAERRAAVAFGGVERYKSEVREARGLSWVPGTWLDFKLGGRMLRKYPALTLVGGLGMAVAIATSVGFFAFASAHIYPVLPLDEGERIVALENRDMEVDNEERRALHDFVQWRDELRSIEDLGAFRTVARNMVLGEGAPELVRMAEMSAAGFTLARVQPLLGRYVVEEDEQPGAPPVVVIGHDTWQSRFAGDPAIVGRGVRFGATTHTVVGVMPDGFAFPQNHEFWIPLRADPAAWKRREGPSIYIFGRLAPGISMEEAQAELEAIGLRTAAAFPETHAKLRPMVMPYIHSLTDIQGISTWMVVQMQLMMSLLLVVVALNVAVLVYARTATRQGEIAMRTALGASRARIVGQLFIEALVLSLGAAAVGLGIAQIGVRLGNRILDLELGAPFWANYSLRPATVLFTIAIAVVAAVIVGVLPALQATGRRLQGNLRQLGGGAGMRLGKTWTLLIVGQIAIAVAALPAAVNMGWGEIRNATTRPTYAAEEFLTASVGAESPAEGEAPTDPGAAAARFSDRFAELIQRLRAEPSVAGVAWSGTLPGRGGRLEVDGIPAPPESPSGHWVAAQGVAPGYLDLYGARILTGRGLQLADADSAATAVVVNRAFVQQVLGGETALGRRVRHVVRPVRADASEADKGRWFEIVGVASDLEANDLDPELVRPRLYYAVTPAQAQGVALEVRLRGSTPAEFAPRLREITVAVDPTLRLGTTYSLADFEEQDKLAVRLVALVIGLILVSVFLLSAAGVYALMSFTVTRRQREIGIRSALGALPRQVLGSIFAGVARQIALGLLVGIVAAGAIDRLTGGELMGGRGGILLPVFGVTMTIVALVAALGPARRALGIEPTEALRGDG